MIQLSDNFYAIPIPEDAVYEFRIDCNEEDPEDKFCTLGMLHKNGGTHKFIEIPFGQYTFIATDKTITEEQAEAIVQKHPMYPIFYRNYQMKIHYANSAYSKALTSFKSLLNSLNLGRVAIIKKT